MPTEAEAYLQVMAAVIADPDRSLDGAIARGVQAGILLERRRIEAFLELEDAKGIERTAIALALGGECSLEAGRSLLPLLRVPAPVTDAQARERRKSFKLVSNEHAK